MQENQSVKSKIVENERKIIEFWDKNNIFQKSLSKTAPKGRFVFYDGPPFATGLPHIGNILAITIKDVIPRYKTMRGFHVPRRWGWDCHGLPIENIIEKELGLNTKKDIERHGVGKFNDAAREAVMRYADNWRKQVPRFGRWVDMENDYRTMDRHYTESVWWVFKTLFNKDLIYEGYKSMHICPRCETTLSNFEVTQGYKDITDISVFVRFKIKNEENTSFLAWTTTPWTLPGNVALAVGKDIAYAKVEIGGEYFIIAKTRLEEVLKGKEYKILSERKGHELVGIEYEPLFNYYAGDENLLNRKNGWKIYSADFVTTEEGTGIVHIAPAFGEDDMKLANEHALPFVQHVSMDGRFKKEVRDFASLEVKPKSAPGLEDDDIRNHQETDIKIIKHLAHNGLLFEKKKIIHPYPHCWRCETPLLNYATTSWFVKVTEIKNKLVKENKKINWVPKDIRDGRFGNWLLGARDWAISRSRFWGAPIPVWRSDDEIFVPGNFDDLKSRLKPKNKYIVMRHGEAENNIKEIMSSLASNEHHLTERGKSQARKAGEALRGKKIDKVYISPFVRTKETAEIVRSVLNIPEGHVKIDKRLREVDSGVFDGKPIKEFRAFFKNYNERFNKKPEGGETYAEIKNRLGDFIAEVDKSHTGQTILIITHEAPAWLLFAVAKGLNIKDTIELRNDKTDYLENAEIKELTFLPIPRNSNHEVDFHRPYIDEVIVYSKSGKPMIRVPEVFDCWFESGSMPYGEAGYKGQKSNSFNPKSGLFAKSVGFPADFIAEGLDQTRGWFYSMLVLGVGLFGTSPFRNVIVNGLVLAEDGRKMSKSLKNYPDPMDVIEKYGADALRYYLLSSPAVAGEDLCFSEKGVDEVSKKLIQKLDNVLSFYEMYSKGFPTHANDILENLSVTNLRYPNILDKWILARLNETVGFVTKSLEKYELDKASRPIMDFVDDLSNWYLRRSRDRFKSEESTDRDSAMITMRYTLISLSKIMAPFIPFYAESMYQRVKSSNGKESVHLENWVVPKPETGDKELIKTMVEVRKFVTLGLEARMKVNIKVRQPLKELQIKNKNLSADFTQLIKDEVNVKNILFDEKLEEGVFLDTEISTDLKEEGYIREFLRTIQDLRKTEGFKVGEEASLIIDAEGSAKILIQKYENELRKGAQLNSIKITPILVGEEANVADSTVKLKLER